MVYGLGTSPDDVLTPHSLIKGLIPEPVVDVLRRALSIDAGMRFSKAGELLQALEAATSFSCLHAPGLGSDEVASARTAMERIRRTIAQALAPPGEIVVPKEIADAVTTVIAWLSQEDTQSLDLVEEIARLGPLAIPICLEQGYRLRRDSSSYRNVVTALTTLGAQDPNIAQRSIDKYALSSNIGVRALCWECCEALKYFPEILLDSLTGDEGVLLPEERINIADFCIRFSKNVTAVLALVKYMCREYIIDHDRYRVLCTKVAHRMYQLQVPDAPGGQSSVSTMWARGSQTITALLITEDCQNCIWQELPEFENLPATAVDETERGLVELMAEAFAATGVAGLEVFKAGRVQRLAGPRNLPVFRRFAIKSGSVNPEVRAWLLKQAKQNCTDRELQKVAEKLDVAKVEVPESAKTLLLEYLSSGDRTLLNKLRFWPTSEVLQLLSSLLPHHHSRVEFGFILQLLKGYQTRHRGAVIDVVLTHWSVLSSHDYAAAVEVLTSYFVPAGQRQQAVELLNRDLSGRHAVSARRGLEQLLR